MWQRRSAKLNCSPLVGCAKKRRVWYAYPPSARSGRCRSWGERKEGFWAVMTETQENIWYSMRSGEKMPRTPSVKKLWTKLPIELGAGICDIWSKVLSQTRYPRALPGWLRRHHVPFCLFEKRDSCNGGKTWSPLGTTIPGKLTTLAQGIKNYVRDSANQGVFLQVINDHLEWFRSHSY